MLRKNSLRQIRNTNEVENFVVKTTQICSTDKKEENPTTEACIEIRFPNTYSEFGSSFR